MSGGELLFTKTDGTKLGPFKVKGADGLGIKNITYDELSGKITFVMTDDTKVGGFMVRGAQGPKGDAGKEGPKGETGLTGNTGAAGVSNVEGPTGQRGLTGLTGTGLIREGSGVVNGQLSLATTDPNLKFGPFNVMGPQGPKGDTGAPGKDATITTSNGIQYPGGRSGGVGYATDVWGNIFAPANGPITTGDHWNLSGKDGMIIQAFTDGTKKTVFHGDISAKNMSATDDISAKNMSATGKMNVTGDISAGGMVFVNGIRYPGDSSGKVGYATDVWGNIFVPPNGPDWGGTNWNLSGKDGVIIQAFTDGTKKTAFHGDITAKNRNILAELDDLKANTVRKDKNYSIKSLAKNTYLRAFSDTYTPRFDAPVNQGGGGGFGLEERVKFEEN
jgi:hypothetical protein